VIFLAEQGVYCLWRVVLPAAVVLREGAVICLGIEAFFFAKIFKKIFVIHEPFVKKGVFLCSLHQNQIV
jgi:hypothetical protein